MKRLALGLFVLLFSSLGGAVAGWWWMTSTEAAICARLEADCGDDAMSESDCLEGRRRELLSRGIGRLRAVEGCLASAPHDCICATACVVGD